MGHGTWGMWRPYKFGGTHKNNSRVYTFNNDDTTKLAHQSRQRQQQQQQQHKWQH